MMSRSDGERNNTGFFQFPSEGNGRAGVIGECTFQRCHETGHKLKPRGSGTNYLAHSASTPNVNKYS